MRRLLLLAAALLALSFAAAAPAGAHAYLVRTDPGDGTTLRTAPPQLRLFFSEHVVLGATRVELVSGSGRHLRLTDLRLSTPDVEDTEAPSVVVAALPRLREDSYRVSWQTLSSDDLHRTSGLLVFGVGRPVTGTSLREPLPRPEEAGLRLLLLLGLCLALGGPLAAATLRPAGASYAQRRVRALTLGGAGVALAASVALLLDQLAPGGLPLGELAGSRYQERWLARETGLVLLAVSALLAQWRLRPQLSRALLLGGGTLACGGTALLGHAGAAGGLTRLLATTVHLAAAATWVGAVAALAVALRPGRHPHEAAGPGPGASLRAFAWPAAGCVTVAAVTGVYLAGEVVGSVDAALRTVYGRTLLVKLGLVGAALLFALANHLRLRRPHGGIPRRTVGAEAAVAALVVAATAVLTSGQPATGPALVRPTVATHGPVSRPVGDLQEAVTLRPDRPGANVVTVDVFDSRRPSPGPVTAVDVGVSGHRTTAATRLPDGHWVVDVADLAAGRADLRVTVHRSGLPDTATTYGWTVPDGLARPPVLVSDAPAGAALRLASGVLALVAAAGWGVAVRRRRRSPASAEGGARRRRAVVAAGPTAAAVLVLAGIAGPASPPPTAAAATTPVSAGARLTAATTTTPGTPEPLVLATAATGTALHGRSSAQALLGAYRAAATSAPTGCHLRPSLVAAVVTARSGWVTDVRSVRLAGTRSAALLCRGGWDLGRAADLAAAVRRLEPSPGFAGLVHRLARRFRAAGMDDPAPLTPVRARVVLHAVAVAPRPTGGPHGSVVSAVLGDDPAAQRVRAVGVAVSRTATAVLAAVAASRPTRTGVPAPSPAASPGVAAPGPLPAGAPATCASPPSEAPADLASGPASPSPAALPTSLPSPGTEVPGAPDVPGVTAAPCAPCAPAATGPAVTTGPCADCPANPADGPTTGPAAPATAALCPGPPTR